MKGNALSALRERMKREGIDYYIVFSEDFHGSEYVGEHFRCREYVSGFTGSAGTLLVDLEKAGLWTDSRYFLQAQQQLSGSGIELFRMGEEGVPTLREYIKKLGPDIRLGFDGRTISADAGKYYAGICPQLRTDLDLVGDIWPDRPPLSAEKAWLLKDEYSGMSRDEKLLWLRKLMEEEKADRLILSSLDDICWLLNIRGGDVRHNPVLLCYVMLSREELRLYVDSEKFSEHDRAELEKSGIVFAAYNSLYEDLKKLPAGSSLMLDSFGVNWEIFCSIPGSVDIIDKTDPVILKKAVKNRAEMANMRKAHLKDGIALTRFMYWLKTNRGKTPMTEISLAEKLEEFRREQEDFLEPSFDTICAYAGHGAIVHYSADEDSDVPVMDKGLLLVDSGGQYMEGTTDVTRTFVMGELQPDEKKYFTLVLMGHLALADAKFIKGCRGSNLDILARRPLWDRGEDYGHGTGHGVGCLLNVHEKPCSFRWKINPDTADRDDCELREGMIISNEPGFYREGCFGIRHENLLLCREGEKTDFGQFMYFETLTMVPYDLEAVDASLMSPEDIRLLNAYHETVYEKISPYLPEAEREWLRDATRSL